MSFTTSSILGADLNNASTTQLFALNQRVTGDGNSEWHYVLATAALTTGQAVTILSAGTAIIAEAQSCLTAAGPDGTTGRLDIGFAQFDVAAGSYAFVCKGGEQLYVLCSGSCIPGTALGFANTGKIVPQVDAVAGATAAGIFITNTVAATSISAVGTALVKFPRKVVPGLQGLM